MVKYTADEKFFTARTNFSLSFPQAIGKQVVILYNSADPGTYTPNSLFLLYAASLGFVIIGALPIGYVVYNFFASD